jgi:hypothetical protein
MAHTLSEGKLEQLISQKRVFLKQTKKDYSEGGNDMLDDLQVELAEAKAELTQRLEVASCIKEDEGEKAYQKECLSLFNAWFEKWFGTP